MKRLSLLLSMTIFAFQLCNAQAKNFKLFNLDIGGMFNYVPTTSDVGFGGYIEPKFNITDNIAIGLKTEAFLGFGGKINSDAGDVKAGLLTMASYGLTGDYFFTTSKVRPFAGLSVNRYTGFRQMVDVSASSNQTSFGQYMTKSYGVAPRVGIQLGSFRLSLEYNYMTYSKTLFEQSGGSNGSQVAVNQNVNVNGASINQSVNTGGDIKTPSQLAQHYIGFKIGGVIGGSRK